MKKTPHLLAALLCMASLASQANPISLSCSTTDNDRALISRLAPDVVKRLDGHRLSVITKNGKRMFVDKPPYDEPLAGVRYQFCDRHDGFMLVLMQEDTQFKGRLVNEETGAVTDGGESVLISHDGRAYFATEQPDGLDGEEWRIYAINGKRSWSGYSFITKPGNPNSAYAYLDKPAWLANGEFTATATCTSKLDIKWAVKLIKNQGEWSWQPQRKCPL